MIEHDYERDDDNNSEGDEERNYWLWWGMRRKAVVDTLDKAVNKIEGSWFEAHRRAPSNRIRAESPRAAASHKEGKQEPHKGAITKMEECGVKERSQRVGGRDNKRWQKPDWMRTEPLIRSPLRKPNFSHKILAFHPAAHSSCVFETSLTRHPNPNHKHPPLNSVSEIPWCAIV